MRVDFYSTFDWAGGAARAAWRTFEAVQRAGVGGCFHAMYRSVDDPRVVAGRGPLLRILPRARAHLDKLPLRLHRRRQRLPFSTGWWPSRELESPGPTGSGSAAVAHLHWVGDGFLSIREIGAFEGPLVWTLHDLWPVTGGCHYPGGCRRFETACGRCPQLGSRREQDLASRLHALKRARFGPLPAVVVSPSRWLAEELRACAVFEQAAVEVIPNPVDTERYRPGDRAEARRRLGLAPGSRVVLFGAAADLRDRRKGFADLERALQRLVAEGAWEDPALVVFGASGDVPSLEGAITVKALGRIASEDDLASVYNAADVFVVPSDEDNLPNTLLEAQACGIPCVAYDAGGIGDAVSDGRTGLLVARGDVDGLAAAIGRLLGDGGLRAAFGEAARRRATQTFSYARIGAAYLDAYRQAVALRESRPGAGGGR